MKILFLFSLIFSSAMVLSQSDYFQQTVNTTIHVSLDDKNHFLHGNVEIEYINQSPDELHKIILHIWPNAYRDNTSELSTQLAENGEVDFHFASSQDRGYIDSLNFTINGKPTLYSQYEGEPDIIEIQLEKPLRPSESLKIASPFKVKIPKGIYSRLGHIGESYQITQWFPKPAVYDKEGWHPMPYLSQGEFYSEYGTYDVHITLPKNYVVGATGDMVNGEEELAFLEERFKATEQLVEKGNFQINKAGKPLMKFPLSSDTLKTLHFHQENVHDFAWFADKRYHVLKGEVELPHSKRKVTTWAMFTNSEFDLWTKSIEYLNDATYYYSLWTGDYPYNHVTAVDGSISAGGGMEYPNVTVIGKSYTAQALEQVIVHEVGHNWFYGILGSNERYNAWMDEGLNTFTENRYTETKYPDGKMSLGLPPAINKKLGLDQFGSRGMYDIGYIFNARRNYDQPIQYPSYLYTPTNYGAIVYGKTGIGFDYLLHYLGNELFDKCMHAYFQEWKFKHPQPEDIRKVFETTSGKDLSWLFDDFIKTTDKMDYGITKLKTKGDSLEITIKNKASIPAPFSIESINQGVVVNSIWHDGTKDKVKLKVPRLGADYLTIDNAQRMPTINRKDDKIKTSGLFKKADPIKIKFLGSFEKPDETHIYYTPVFGYNAQDKFMMGMAFYNTAIPERKLEWLAMPMFGFGSKKAVGIGDLKYNIYPNEGFIRKTTLGYQFKSFTQEFLNPTYDFPDPIIINIPMVELNYQNWLKNEVYVDFELNNQSLRKAKHNVLLRGIHINENIPMMQTVDRTFAVNFRYILQNRQVLKPASLKFDVISLNSNFYGSFTGVTMEAKFRKNYNVDLKGFEFRFFAAQTLDRNENNFTTRYAWSLTGQQGESDYLYDYTLLGRNQSSPNMLMQQSTGTHGDFKVTTPFVMGRSDSWLLAMNFKIEAPIKIPVGLFVDAGLIPIVVNNNGQISNETQLAYNAGLYFPIRKDIFEIYLPFLYSEDIKNAIEFNNVTFGQRIRFILHLNQINPFKLIKEIKP